MTYDYDALDAIFDAAEELEDDYVDRALSFYGLAPINNWCDIILIEHYRRDVDVAIWWYEDDGEVLSISAAPMGYKSWEAMNIHRGKWGL